MKTHSEPAKKMQMISSYVRLYCHAATFLDLQTSILVCTDFFCVTSQDRYERDIYHPRMRIRRLVNAIRYNYAYFFVSYAPSDPFITLLEHQILRYNNMHAK